MDKNQDLSCGKMSPEHSAPTREKISVPFSKRSAKSKTNQCLCLNLTNGTVQEKSWEMITPLPGDSLMLNFGEYPREENVSTLPPPSQPLRIFSVFGVSTTNG